MERSLLLQVVTRRGVVGASLLALLVVITNISSAAWANQPEASAPCEDNALLTNDQKTLISELPGKLSKAIISPYDVFLSKYPLIAETIDIKKGDERTQFEKAIIHLEGSGRLPVFNLPVGMRLTEDDDRALHIRHAAYALWLELNHKVPWSITAYSVDEIKQLLSPNALSDRGFIRSWSVELHEGFYQQQWLRKTQKETILALTEWVRGHIVHKSSKEPDPDLYVTALKGGAVGSCHNVGDFMAISSLALNIPIKSDLQPTDHRYIDFPSERMLMVHGDDPYSRSYSQVPVEAFFITNTERENFQKQLGASKKESDRFMKAHMASLTLQYPNNELLRKACEGGAAIVNELYAIYGCEGCSSLQDYSQDAEKFVHDAYPRLRSQAIKAGYCTPE